MALLWLTIAGVGGILAILGSLMSLGSLLLWWVPPHRKPTGSSEPDWFSRLKLTGFSLALALVGVGLLLAVPFPQGPGSG